MYRFVLLQANVLFGTAAGDGAAVEEQEPHANPQKLLIIRQPMHLCVLAATPLVPEAGLQEGGGEATGAVNGPRQKRAWLQEGCSEATCGSRWAECMLCWPTWGTHIMRGKRVAEGSQQQ